MKIFTQMMSVVMVLLLSSALVFGQSSNLEKVKVDKTTDLTTDTYDGVKPIPNPNSVISNVSYASSNPAKDVLYDNGPLITHPTGGFGGNPASALQSVTGGALTTYGFGAQQSAGNSMADDFTVTGTWTLNTMKFFAYQTGSTTTSTMTGIYVQIWNGAPNAGGAIVWGDLTTNRLASTQWSGIYRSIETDLLASNRPIMEVVANMTGCVLTAGTYWVEYQFTGTLTSGPWAPPISIWDQAITGNGLQYTTAAGWAAIVSGTAPNTYAQGLPFVVDGTEGSGGTIVFEDNFDAYTAGGQVACQNPTGWTTWSNAPCGSEDAYVSSLYSYSSPNSAVIAQNNDLVKDFGDPITSGKYSISFNAYIPATKAGYFNTLQTFTGAQVWGLEVYFNAGGAGSINAGGTGTATFTWTPDVWFIVEHIIDMETDMSEIWIDGNMIYSYQWSLGATGTGQNSLEANDFFGATANDQLYMDDYVFEELPVIVVLNPPTDLTATAVDNDVHLDWNAPASDDLLGYNVYRDAMMLDYTTATEYDDMDLETGTYEYYVTAVYDDGESVASNTASVTISGSGSGVIYTYDFENYTAGGQLACQTPDEWTTWSNAPCGAEDPFISTEQAFSGVNSVVIEGTNDCVKTFDDYTSGHYTISFQMYVPSGYVGYFNTLQDFAGASSQWGMQVMFDVNGAGSIDGGGAAAATFNFPYDTWMLNVVDVNLDEDWADYYLDGILIHGWVWSGGSFGTGTLNKLDATNFYAWTGVSTTETPKFFIDDYMLEGVLPLAPPTNLTSTVTSGDVVLNWTAPAGKSYNKNAQNEELSTQTTSELSKYTNSVHNNLLSEYKLNGQEVQAQQMITDAKVPAKYKAIKLDIKGATAYACVAYDPSSVNPIGPATFDTDFPGTITSLAPGSSADFIAGGSWAEGVWYGEEYGTSALYTIDPSSGAMNLVGYGSGSGGFNAIAYDVTTFTMYGCDYNGTSCGLYSINLSTGASTFIGDVGLGALVIGMACDASGNLYAADLFADNLLSINKTTGAGAIIGSMGIDINYAQDLEYDNENDVLYLAGYTSTGQLYTIDPNTGTATYVGDFQGGAEMCGLAFEYTAVQYTNDIGIQSILSPNSGVNLGNETVSVRIKNFGTASQSNFTISYTMDGGAPVNATITNTIAGGATFDYTFPGTVNLSAYGTYTFVACTYLTGDENTGNDCKTKPVSNNYPAYCDATTGTQDEYIGNVLCGAINNTTGWQGGVGNYTDMSTTIDAGMSEDITVTNGGNLYASDMVTCWVDWNMNYVFDQGGNEEFILLNVGGTGQTFTGAIAVPAGTPNGDYTMRVRMTWSTAPVPCGAASYGEVEDYTINVGGSVTGLLGYNVYHSYQNGTFSVLAYVTPTTYTHFDPAIGLHKYYVTAVYDTGESGPTNTVEEVIVGIQESISEATQIYPNPAKDMLNIKSEFDIKSVRVYNHAGQLMNSELVNTKFYQFNTSNFTPGLYLFQVETNEGTMTKRIIIE